MDPEVQFSNADDPIHEKNCCDAQTQLQNGGHHWWAPRQHEISKRSCRGFPKGLLFNVPSATWFADALQGPWQQKTVEHDKQMPFALPHRWQLEPFEPTQNMVSSRRRSDEKGSKVGTKLPEKAVWLQPPKWWSISDWPCISLGANVEKLAAIKRRSKLHTTLPKHFFDISQGFHLPGLHLRDFTWEASLERLHLRHFTWEFIGHFQTFCRFVVWINFKKIDYLIELPISQISQTTYRLFGIYLYKQLSD